MTIRELAKAKQDAGAYVWLATPGLHRKNAVEESRWRLYPRDSVAVISLYYFLGASNGNYAEKTQ